MTVNAAAHDLTDPATDPFAVADAAAAVIRERTGVERHDVALVLGSGWGQTGDLIGATLVDAAKTTTRVAFFGALIIGVFNVILLSALKDYIPYLFTSDEEVVRLTSAVLPLCAAFQLFDALAALCNGVLRGLGRQHFGGYVQLFCYYVIAMPISFGTTFGLNWGLFGLWSGVALALGLVALIEFLYLGRTDWNSSVEEARQRNVLE